VPAVAADNRTEAVFLPAANAAAAGAIVCPFAMVLPGRAFFGGDAFVDPHDASHVSVVDDGGAAANTFYEKVFEPAHVGWLVNGWWRVIRIVLGRTPRPAYPAVLATRPPRPPPPTATTPQPTGVRPAPAPAGGGVG
jgi:hypothetical protein